MRMNETDGEYEITEEVFWEVEGKYETKKKKSYNFLKKASKGFKEAILKFVKNA